MRQAIYALVIITGIVVSIALPTQAESVLKAESLYIFTDSQYKAFLETFPLWQSGIFAVEGGIGVVAWRVWDPHPGPVPGDWDWRTDPALRAAVRATVYATPRLEFYGRTSLITSISEHQNFLPQFRRMDMLVSAGLRFQLLRSIAFYGELGFPIGWDSIPTAFGFGVSMRL